jgi:hypothetical protein
VVGTKVGSVIGSDDGLVAASEKSVSIRSLHGGSEVVMTARVTAGVVLGSSDGSEACIGVPDKYVDETLSGTKVAAAICEP